MSQPVGGGGPDQTNALVLQPNGTPAISERGVGFSKGAAPLSCPDGALWLPIAGPSEVQRAYGGVLVFRPGQAHPTRLLSHLGMDVLAQRCGGTVYAIVSDSTGSTSLAALTPAGHILWRQSDPSSNGTLSIVLAGQRNMVYVAGSGSLPPQSPSIEIGPGGRLLVLDTGGDLRMYGH